MSDRETILDLRNQVMIYRKLTRFQDQLLMAYRLGRRPPDSAIEGITRMRDALAPYLQRDILREQRPEDPEAST